MKVRHLFIRILLLASFINLPLNVFALSNGLFGGLTGDDDFIAARRAFDKKDIAALSVNLQQLQTEHYILAPYADYWLMLLQLSKSDGQPDNPIDNNSVTTFLEKYNDYPFADRVRGEWLKSLAKRQDWTTFFNELPNFH